MIEKNGTGVLEDLDAIPGSAAVSAVAVMEGKIAGSLRPRKRCLISASVPACNSAVVEFARDVAGCGPRAPTEFVQGTPASGDRPDYRVGWMPPARHREAQRGSDIGGTMRLGAQVQTGDGSLARQIYGPLPEITERHRHRYEK